MRSLRTTALCLLPLLAATMTTPASAQEVKLDELRGATISVTVTRSIRLQRGDRRDVELLEDMIDLTFGPDSVAQLAQARKTIGPGRSRLFRKSYTAKIDSVRTARAGYAALVYLNSTLTWMRTLSKGARKFEIKFTRSPDGLTCTARRLWMQEIGADSIVSQNPRTKAPIVIVSERQVSQTCRVTKP
jgi:hypothetical protein